VNIRQQIKSNPYGSLIWRVFIGVIGGLITIIGTIFLFAPGPGLLVLLAGLGILATEFAWAANAIRNSTFHSGSSILLLLAEQSFLSPYWSIFTLD
jgi:uncharacterized protein (TIGR02611 family)